jgi:EmrB/QacA subfamily drug resistance transporter
MHTATAPAAETFGARWSRFVRGRPMDESTIARRRWWALAILNLSLFAIIMDNTILNVALPTLAKDLHASGSDLQWIVDGYVLVFAGLLLSAGALGDRFGRRGALSAGLVVFAAGSVFAMTADSASMLIAARAVMGVGGALIMPATLSILTNVFTDPKERAKAIAMWASVGGLAVALGPVMGGWLLEHFSWSAMFAINIPVAAIALTAGRFVVPTSRDPETPPLDVPGAVLSIIGLGSLVWAIISAGEHGWTAAGPLTGFAVAAVATAVFITWERRTPYPMLDISFFKNRRFTAASLGVMLGYFAMFGALFLMSQLLQFVLGYSALDAGIRLLPFALSMSVFATVSTKGRNRRHEDRRRRRHEHRRRRSAVGRQPRRRQHLPRLPARHAAHGHRHRPHLGTDHRVDHGVPSARQGRRRLGRQRHRP